MSLFWKLEREIGLQEALECFWRAVDSGKEELEHDVMGCQDCWAHGDIVYCEKSKFHPNHPFIAALLGKIVIVWRLSIVLTCLPLNQACISIVLNCYIGLRFSPAFYVTNFLANM